MTQPDTPHTTQQGEEAPGGMSILLAFEEGKEVGKNLTARERAVLDAAKEWAAAEDDWEHCRLLQGATLVLPIVTRRKAATAALRAAVDALTRAHAGKEEG